MNILFWNTHKNECESIDSCLSELVLENECDILVLAEYTKEIKNLCSLINVKSMDTYIPLPNISGCDKIKGLIKNKYKVEPVCEVTRYQIITVSTTTYNLIIGMIHNFDKRSADEEKQKENLRQFYRDIYDVEEKSGIKCSVAIGDFNVNPFESACISANVLHAIPFTDEVKNPMRIIDGKKFRKFYNPMWKFYGNREPPYTTYRYNKGGMVEYYWHMYDQIIIRPELINSFDDDSLKIITKTLNHKLVLNKKPYTKNYSDHLPLFCTLKEENIL